jgi:alanyl-tRNA synthetase
MDQAGFEAGNGGAAGTRPRPQPVRLRQTADLGVEGCTEFHGYDRWRKRATVVALFARRPAVEALNAGDEGVVVLDRTPFYAESGGQVGDAGWLRADGLEFEVRDTQKQGGAFSRTSEC